MVEQENFIIAVTQRVVGAKLFLGGSERRSIVAATLIPPRQAGFVAWRDLRL